METTARKPASVTASPDVNRARALRAVAVAAAKREKAEADELLAMRIANQGGASLREIAHAADRNHATVGRMLQRDAR